MPENLSEYEPDLTIRKAEISSSNIIDKAAFIAKVLARRSDMQVLPGSGWAAGLSAEVNKILARGVNLDEIDPALLEPKILTYPKEDLTTKNDDYILGVTRHEIGHFLYSDYRRLLEFQKKAKDEGKNPDDAMTLANALEDPRVDGLQAGQSSRARERLEGIYRENMPGFLANIGEKSPPTQFNSLVIASWAERFGESQFLEEAMAQVTSDQAKQAFIETKDAILKAIQQKKATSAAEIMETEIWPIYRELVDDYLENSSDSDSEARIKLDQENKDFNNQFGPKTMTQEKDEEGITHYKPNSPNSEDIEDIKQQIKERIQEQAEQSRAEKEKMDLQSQEARRVAAGLSERRTGLSEGEQQKYNQYLAEMKPYINQLLKRLDEIFPTEESFEWQKGQQRGARVEARRLAREATTGRGQFFESKEITEKPKVIASILMDVSGSMHWGGALELAVKEMIMITESLAQRGIDFELIAFSDTPEIVKSFDDVFSGSTRKKIIGLLESGGGGTALGKSVDFASERINKKMRKDQTPGFMVVHTDGEPGDDLVSALTRWQGRFPIVGIGVGTDITEGLIKQYFGDAGRYTANPVDAPREILDVLKTQFSRYRKKA